MADSAWTPVDESAAKWTPVQEAPSLWDRVKTAFASRPVEHSQGPYGIPGSFEGHPENVGEWVPAGPGQIGAGAVDVARGNIARGGHKMISGAGNTLLLTLPFVAAAAPLATARGIVGGTVGSEAGQRGAVALGASEDQAQLAGDIGGLAGGYGGAKLNRKVATAPIRYGARASESALNQKLVPTKPLLRINTPADEAEAVNIKVPGRDVGLRPRTSLIEQVRAGGRAVEGQTDQVPGRPYQPRPRSYTARPAQPIASRSGLMLTGEVEPQAAALGRLPATGARSAAETGEALGDPQRLIEKVRTAEDVTPALTGKRPSYYGTDEQAWQRYPKPGSSQDVAETRSLQEQIRDQSYAEQRGRLSRGSEQGYAENTRPRTPKGELTKQSRARSSGRPGMRLIDQIKVQSADEDLTPLLEESLRRALKGSE